MTHVHSSAELEGDQHSAAAAPDELKVVRVRSITMFDISAKPFISAAL